MLKVLTSEDKLNDLIGLLREITDEEFDMRDWTNDCGTVGCIAGTYFLRRAPRDLVDAWLTWSRQPELDRLPRPRDTPYCWTATALGLDLDLAYDLFILGAWAGGVTREQAIRAVEHVRDRGRPHWDEVCGT